MCQRTGAPRRRNTQTKETVARSRLPKSRTTVQHLRRSTANLSVLIMFPIDCISLILQFSYHFMHPEHAQVFARRRTDLAEIFECYQKFDSILPYAALGESDAQKDPLKCLCLVRKPPVLKTLSVSVLVREMTSCRTEYS